MKAVRYPTDPTERNNLKQRYVAAISVQKNKYGKNKLLRGQKDWRKIRRRLPEGNRFPSDIRKILRAEYPKLIAYYLHYIQIEPSISTVDKTTLKRIFSYEAYHDTIANFFMDSQNGFNLSVCHYCGIAYINKYTVKGDQDGLDTINNASKAELGKLMRIKSPDTIESVYAGKSYTSVAQFNRSAKFRISDKFHSIFPASVDKNHFDLDHVLDKGRCPITAISLLNFVPSCGVCNEKLKKEKILGRGGIPIEELSPTSKHFDFDRQVTFMLTPKPGKKISNKPTAHEDDYDLDMNVKNPDYNLFVEMFHLRERYRFHKMEALFWLELKYRYTDSRIALMANSLHDASYTVKRIKDDIFQKPLDQRERCFEKLKRDILK